MCKPQGIAWHEKGREDNRKELQQIKSMSEQECQDEWGRSQSEQAQIVQDIIQKTTNKIIKYRQVSYGPQFFSVAAGASAQDATTQHSGLFSLPPEIRHQIYQYVIGSTTNRCLHVLGNEASFTRYDQRMEIDKVRFEVCPWDDEENEEADEGDHFLSDTAAHCDYNEYGKYGYVDLRFAQASRALHRDVLTTFLGAYNFVFACPCSFNAFVSYLGSENLKLVRRVTLALEVSDFIDNTYLEEGVKTLVGLKRITLDFRLQDSPKWRSEGYVYTEEDISCFRGYLSEMENLLLFPNHLEVEKVVQCQSSYCARIRDERAIEMCEEFAQCVSASNGLERWIEYKQQFAELDRRHKPHKPTAEKDYSAIVLTL